MSQEAKMLLGFGLVTLVVLVGGILFLSKSQPGVTTPSVVGEDTKKLLIKSDSHKSTEKTTKVQLVEFADFQCPVCATSYPVIENIRKIYKDQITYVYRYFPLTQHQWAKDTAYAAEAAGKQGKFWEMYSLLFSRQNEWSEKSSITDILLSYAKELHLDINQFSKDMASDEVHKRVDEDFMDGTSMGVNATPTFYLNGEQSVGVPQETDLKEKIDALLKE